MLSLLGPRSLHYGKLLQGTAPLNRGLVGWWRPLPSTLGGLVWRDLASPRVATIGTGGTWRGVGAPGQAGALQFAATGAYVTLPTRTLSPLQPTARYTWAFWIKPHVFTEWQGLYHAFVTNGVDPAVNIYVMTTADTLSGPLTAGIVAAWNTSGTQYLIMHSQNNVLAVDTWAHVVVTYTGSLAQASRFTIYVNGVNVSVLGDVSSIGTIAALTPTEVRLGKDHYGDPSWDGALGEVRLWTRALSASEVRSFYTEGMGGLVRENELADLAAVVGGRSGSGQCGDHAADDAASRELRPYESWGSLCLIIRGKRASRVKV